MLTGKPQTNWPRRLGYVAAFGFLLDRFLKMLAFMRQDDILGWPNLAEFKLFMNKGIAFSIELPRVVFWLAIVIASIAVLAAFIQSRRRHRWLTAGFLVIVLAGAISNVIDRLLYSATVDYLIFFGLSAVNLADGMIVAGLIGWLWCQNRARKAT